METDKKVVIVGRGLDDEIVAAIRHCGWQIKHIPDYPQLRPSRGINDATAGLILAEAQFARHVPSLRNTVATLGIDWLIILDRQLLSHPVVRAFVNESCYDYHCLPVDINRLCVTLGRMHGHRAIWLQQEEEQEPEGELVGRHPLILQLKKDIHKIARTNVNILIVGESGTGKELVARSAHQHSPRHAEPFLAVNCGGLPAGLVQSELFGHEKGAFTGAHAKRIGHVEAANGGTLFLDEVGDMALEAQVNLLRFLQEGTIDRLGGRQQLTVDVRVISATHIDLLNAVTDGKFREDLFYRLNVCKLSLPPLRQRATDILLLANHLLEKHAARLGVPRRRLALESRDVMMRYAWPGNVRELSNRLCRGLVMASGRTIQPGDIGLTYLNGHEVPLLLTLDSARLKVEKETLELALQLSDGHSAAAARLLGISRATMYRLLQKHHVYADLEQLLSELAPSAPKRPRR
ncbi:sigma 54-interacting transcriptional regulator [Vogesella indigofera]|uniref:sigma-54 dependent transcriptional regulator n=1 Tax=Vogesella indigofera TaxID=45465 RepID=UPI003F435F46